MALQTNHDPSSPYYIHPSDASTTQLVSVKFNGIGFHNWKRSMVLTLSAKNKLGFVDGSIQMPDITSAQYKCWERCNNLVISWLLFNLDEARAKSVLFLQTAKKIWQDLEDRYGYTSMAQVYSLEQQLLDISQGSDSVSDFFTKIKTIWDGLSDASPMPYCTCNQCTCNLFQRLVQKQQEQRVLQFMMKLSDEFSMIRGNVLMMQPLPNISQTYRLFTQEERYKSISTANAQTESMAFYADNRKFHPQSQAQRFSNNNFQQRPSYGPRPNLDPSKKVTKPASGYFCNHCKIPGHSIERCFKIHGYPPSFQVRPQKRFAAFAQQEIEENVIVDSSTDKAGTSETVSIEQYNHLLQMLNQQNIQGDSDTQDTSKHALLAGPFSEKASDSSW